MPLRSLVLMASGLLLVTKFEVLGTLDRQLLLALAGLAFQTKYNLLGGLSLLVEDRLGLTTETLLLVAVTTITLGGLTGGTLLVLRHLVDSVLAAPLVLAVGTAFLWYVNHLVLLLLQCHEWYVNHL